ncbi:MAG: regulatory protein RecX, partial [Lachnospiraceae bacterium]|nr:regulatory protein RecX [Lachnospiraceae bacterium]
TKDTRTEGPLPEGQGEAFPGGCAGAGPEGGGRTDACREPVPDRCPGHVSEAGSRSDACAEAFPNGRAGAGTEDGSRSDGRAEVIRQAKKKALKLLEFSDRTERKLREKLEEAGFPAPAVDEAVEYVRSFHYLDDRRFAESYIRGHFGRKSRKEILEALKEKGVSTEDAEAAAETFEWDDAETVRALFERKYGLKDPGDPKLYEKAFRYFAGKGFSYQDIKHGIGEALRDSGDSVNS